MRPTTFTSLTPAIIAFRNSTRVARSLLNGERMALATDSLIRRGECQLMDWVMYMLPIRVTIAFRNFHRPVHLFRVAGRVAPATASFLDHRMWGLILRAPTM